MQEWPERWIALGHAPEPAYRALMRARAAQGDLAGMAAAYRRSLVATQSWPKLAGCWNATPIVAC
ncbi:MAG TPA: hypothetical protein VK879_10425 [Candidatus Sulfomarinibacteraceae bacterium]|nr:hypothetical protein [Candidatus Sulfomarinibacteraceae bacterium]